MDSRKFFGVVWICASLVGLYLVYDGNKKLGADTENLKLAAASVNWPKTECAIKENELTVVNEGKSYQPKLTYAYELAGKTYTSNQISLATSLELYADNEQFVKDFLSHFPTGSKHVARYNPNNPSQSVLVPGAEVNSVQVPGFLGIVGGSAVALGALGVALAYFIQNPSTLRGQYWATRLPVYVAGALICIASFAGLAFQHRVAESIVPPEGRVYVSSTGYTIGNSDKEVRY